VRVCHSGATRPKSTESGVAGGARLRARTAYRVRVVAGEAIVSAMERDTAQQAQLP
jgi:hypothetical protein